MDRRAHGRGNEYRAEEDTGEDELPNVIVYTITFAVLAPLNAEDVTIVTFLIALPAAPVTVVIYCMVETGGHLTGSIDGRGSHSGQKACGLLQMVTIQ